MTPWTVTHQAPLSMGILQARILEWVAMPSSRESSQPRDRTQVSRVADSLSSEPPGKPMNTGVDSLSLLQGITPTQELNWGLPHCRWILYQLSYQGSPSLPFTLFSFKFLFCPSIQPVFHPFIHPSICHPLFLHTCHELGIMPVRGETTMNKKEYVPHETW